MYIDKINKDRLDKVILDILVGQRINTKKLKKLEQFKNQYIHVTMHDRPLQTLFTITKDQNVIALRQSTDDTALLGYKELANELLEIQDLQAVFIGTSSGTTAQALSEYFESQNRKIEMHIVQTSSCYSMSSAFVDNEAPDEQSIAEAIVDHGAIRKTFLIKLIEKNGGSGWIASNEQIISSQEITKKNTDLSISTNSALSVAGLMQAVYTGRSWAGSVVCIICGD
jgi:threonine dehydratase